MTRAEQYLHAFASGEDFHPPVEGLTVGGRPDPREVAVLDAGLSAAPPPVGVNIIHLLVALGLSVEPENRKGAWVLRDGAIIDVLVRAVCCVQASMVSQVAADALRKLLIVDALAPHRDSFVRALELDPTEEVLFLIAKAKAAAANPQLHRLADQDEWGESDALKITMAALGDRQKEDAYLRGADEAEVAHNGAALTEALGSLGLIGTPRALRAVAARLRSPLILSLPGRAKQSIRLNVLDALFYNFPDERRFQRQTIVSDAGYGEAEQACHERLGVTYSEPRPPFLTRLGGPIPAR